MAPHIFGKEVLPRLIQPLELSKQITLRQCTLCLQLQHR